MSYVLPLLVSCLVCTALGHSKYNKNNATVENPIEIALHGPKNFFEDIGKGIQMEAADIKQPVEEAVVYVGSSQCKIGFIILSHIISGNKGPLLNDIGCEFK